MTNKNISLFSLGLLSLFTACAITPINELSPEKGMERIRAAHKDKEWTAVIQDVDEYTIRYPYSQFMIEADLLQADAYYESGKYPEAVGAYEEFIRKNPNDKNTGFAYFRMAKCYDLQAPDSDEKDESNATKALEKYKFYVLNYSKEPFVDEAQKRIEVLEKRLEDRDIFIADFYWHQKLYAGALNQYLLILKNNHHLEDSKKHEIQQRASECYQQLALMLEKNPSDDKYSFFIDETPSSLRQKAKEILNENSRN